MPVERLLVAACSYLDAQRLHLGSEDYGEGFQLARNRLVACIMLITDASTLSLPIEPAVSPPLLKKYSSHLRYYVLHGICYRAQARLIWHACLSQQLHC
jgi:hypothetical protein